MYLEYIVKDNKYQNINQILKQEFHISTRLQQKLIKSSQISQNSIPVDTRNSININDIITIRGKGKFIFDGIEKETRSGRYLLNMRKYK